MDASNGKPCLIVTQAWTAFHRLRPFLRNALIPLKRRVTLWLTCVWSIASYGLTAAGVDEQSAAKLRGMMFKQLRVVGRSPAHLSRETNLNLLQRLSCEDPIVMLHRQCRDRISHCRQVVAHIQPNRVQQWWNLLLAELRLHCSAGAREHGSLVEVTAVARIRCECPHCGQAFPSTHALRVHIGKQHPEHQPQKTRSTTTK